MPEETLQPGAGDGLDTYIAQNAATTNYGTSTALQVYYETDGDNRDALLKFDLSNIEPGSVIESATLSLYVDGYISLAIRADIWRILPANSGWTETGATWNTIDGATAWAGAAGCETKGTDYANTPLYEMTADFSSGWNDFVLNVSEFQALIDVGNYGLIVKGQVRNPTISRGVNISSSDHATSAQHPKLTVRWIAPSRRVYEYTFNIESGKGLVDSKGQVMDPVDIEVDKWVRILGLEPPLRGDYDTMIEHPNYCYIVSKIYDEDQGSVRIRTDRNQFADQLISRILRGG